MQGFIDALEQDPEAAQLQQSTIKQFLALCKQQGATKLIVDLQTNPGGKIFSGFDAFQQLFPTIDPFGATRLRSTPMVNYFGAIFSEADNYSNSFNEWYQIQVNVDGDDQPFTSWSQEDPPDVIYGDNFTAELRYNPSSFNNSDIAAQVFQSEDIVILYDGSCGSTCSIFSELMKSQGGVRSGKSRQSHFHALNLQLTLSFSCCGRTPPNRSNARCSWVQRGGGPHIRRNPDDVFRNLLRLVGGPTKRGHAPAPPLPLLPLGTPPIRLPPRKQQESLEGLAFQSPEQHAHERHLLHTTPIHLRGCELSLILH